MKNFAAAVFATVALTTVAFAAEMEAVVKAYDPATKTVTLEDGTSWVLAEGVDAAALVAGAKVMVTVDDASKTVTAVKTAAQ